MSALAVCGSQVSKAGASKVLLAVKYGDGLDAKFDFTGADNGESWRNTFKDAIANAMSAVRGGGGGVGAGAGAGAGGGGGGVKASSTGTGAPVHGSSQADAAGKGAVETLDISQVSKYFEEFPK